MPALGGKCERKWGGTECANTETYDYHFGGGKLMCSHPNPHGESRCCIKSGQWAFYEMGVSWTRVPNTDPGKDCCSGEWYKKLKGDTWGPVFHTAICK
eukprot:Skav202171  [mRNA]  locus=scaffold482:34812:35105:+ [translate_table: standard]